MPHITPVLPMPPGWSPIPTAGMPFPPGSIACIKAHVRVLFSYEGEEYHPDGPWMHLSLSTSFRYPTWEEILDCRYTFLKDSEEVFQYLPKKAEYLNLHPYCFHLWAPVGRRVTPGVGHQEVAEWPPKVKGGSVE